MTIRKKGEKIAVIGGTKYDTNIGCSLIREKGFWCRGYPIANTADEQNLLQYFNKHDLQLKIEKIARGLGEEHYDTLLIFCNSLSMILDLKKLSNATDLQIISTIDIYKSLTTKFNRMMILTANGQSLYGIEKIMLKSRKDIEIFGISNLSLVNSIESGLSPRAIFQKWHIKNILDLAEKISVQSIILGCTHLTNLYEIISKSSTIPVIDIGRELAAHLEADEIRR